jgi:DNA polymerase I
MQPKHLLLIDGSSYLFRAYHALPPLTNAHGEPTGAIYGVLNMIKKLQTLCPHDQIAFVFDAKGKTERHAIYPEYKANRDAMPDTLAVQIPILHEVIEALGLPLVINPGYEADDIMATLAKRAKKTGAKTTIATLDKDMAQLVDEDTIFWHTRKHTAMDRDSIFERYGVYPEQIRDYLALIGDAVDNIPGIPKVGPKTAAKWLNQYHDLDQLIASADCVSGKVGDNLRAHIDQLPLSKQLVTLNADVPLPEGWDWLETKAPDTEKLQAHYTRLNFKGWLKDLEKKDEKPSKKNHPGQETLPLFGSETPETTQSDPKHTQHTILRDLAACTHWFDLLTQDGLFALDTETTGLDAQRCDLVGLSFASAQAPGLYLPLAHDDPGPEGQCSLSEVLPLLQKLLNQPNITIVGHHLKYDLKVLARHDIPVSAPVEDTLLASYVLFGSSRRHSLDALAQTLLNHDTITFEAIAGKGVKQKTFNQIPLNEAAPYAAEDANVTLALHHHLQGLLREEPTLQNLYQKMDLPCMYVLMHMEQQGVLIDAKKLEKQSQELEKKLEHLTEQAHKEAGQPFDLRSTKQLRALLFDTLGLPVLQKTPKGEPATAEHVLKQLAEKHPLPAIILEHRHLSKLKSTYTDRLPELIHPNTNRIHCSYNQAVTSTGRLSSTQPNLQNIPIRTEVGRRIREAFIAPKDHLILAADYSQIELRIMAHLSKEPRLIDAFQAHQDIHRITAAEVFSVSEDAVTEAQRRQAKAINFGLMYGMSSFGLAKQMNVSRTDAQAYINQYFKRYPGVKAFMTQAQEEGTQQGYVSTLMGRRVYLPGIDGGHQYRQAALRQAINAPLQGTASDLIKVAMIELDQACTSGKIAARMIMQVHDELVFEVHKDHVDTAQAYIKKVMEQAADLCVPLIVAIGTGDNWDQAH